MAFKIFRKNCCGLDVHKTWIYACSAQKVKSTRISRAGSFLKPILV